MKIVATYDFNGGKSAVLQRYAAEFAQIQSVISAIDASLFIKQLYDQEMD